jgi:hypothetical protein
MLRRMWSRAGGVGVACLLAAAQIVAVSADTATADLIPGPPDGSWQVYAAETGPKTKEDLYGGQANRVQGFVDAYDKSWTASPRLALLDRLERYSSIFWAAYRLGQSEAADKKDKNFTSYRTVPGFGSAAYEVTSGPDADGTYTDVIVFTSGDYLSAIALAGKTPPDHATLMDQASRQLSLIPEPTNETNAIGTGIVNTIVIVAIGAGAVTIIVGAIVIITVLRTRRPRPQPAFAPAGLSPDRRYWWDGMSWQDTAAQLPPGVPLSPDGTHWWDGVSWRPRPPG